MTKMTTEERRLYDAQADHDAWSYAHEIMEPWMAIVHSVASDELLQVMEPAFAEVEKRVGTTFDVLADLDEGIEPAGSYSMVLERICRAHGFSGAEEVAHRAAELAPEYAARELLESPAAGFGTILDAVLGMNEVERWRLSAAFARSFLSQAAARRKPA